MKKILFALSTVVLLASCSNDNPRTAAETKLITPTDTAGLAQFQAWKMQNELAASNQLAQQNLAAAQPAKEVVRERVVYVEKPAARRRATTTRSSGSSSTGNSSGSSTSTSGNTARKKEGWSKTAKGAVIGGVGGAVIGGVVNKRNRGAGAVIGGVIGAGAGAVIGRAKDKKDGRY